MIRPIRVLIADIDAAFCNQVFYQLSNNPIFDPVGIAYDIDQIIAMLPECEPDVLVLGLELEAVERNALCLRMYKMQSPPIVLLIADDYNSNVAAMMKQLQAPYLQRRPCDIPALAEHIHDCTKASHKLDTRSDTLMLVRETLQQLDLPSYMVGYQYLVWALTFAIEDDDILHAVTKELYPMVAEACNSTADKVVSGIRNTIKVYWDRTAPSSLEEYYKTTSRPSNAAFIRLLLQRVQKLRANPFLAYYDAYPEMLKLAEQSQTSTD